MMADRRHRSADRQRSHAAGQRKIVHYCACGKAPRGNAAWWSHINARKPGCSEISYSQWLAGQAGQSGTLAEQIQRWSPDE